MPRAVFANDEERRLAKNARERERVRKNKEKIREKKREYSRKNKEAIAIKWQEWYANNKEKHSNNAREWKINNRERNNERKRLKEKEKRSNDENYDFICRVRTMLYSSFNRNGKRYSKELCSEKLLGCTIEEFRDYILSKCPKGTTLKDFNRYGYHIDHIIPISFAKTKEDIVKLCHYTNLQPLWWKDNIVKSNKIIENVKL